MRSWKMLSRVRPVLLASTLFVLGSGMASAETYLGASYGESDGNDSELSDKTSDGWRVFLGAGAGDVFGWEVGYGEVDNLKGRTLGNIDISGVDASLLIGLPLGPFRLFGRLGAVMTSVDSDNLSSSDDWTYRYGVGGDLNLGKTFALRIEWNRTPIRSDLI